MPQAIYQVDSFSTQPFAGNPAGVCPLSAPADEAWMQNVAREMNLSETAFFYPVADGYHLRWFTPGTEVSLCGHATLATAHILWETGLLPCSQTARFHTLSGLLTAEQVGDWIELDFPTRPVEPCALPAGLLEAVGVQNATFTGQSRNSYLIEVESVEAVRAARPDFAALLALPLRAVAITSRDDSGTYDFVSRFFAPAVGVNEDPVTGSAHCYLTPYWAERLGKSELRAFQASARGGELRLRLLGDRVRIGGQAVTVLRGELLAEQP